MGEDREFDLTTATRNDIFDNDLIRIRIEVVSNRIFTNAQERWIFLQSLEIQAQKICPAPPTRTLWQRAVDPRQPVADYIAFFFDGLG